MLEWIDAYTWPILRGLSYDKHLWQLTERAIEFSYERQRMCDGNVSTTIISIVLKWAKVPIWWAYIVSKTYNGI